MMIVTGVKSGAAIVAVLLVFGAGWKVRDWQNSETERWRLEAKEEARQHMAGIIDQVNANTAEAIANIRVENRTIHQKAIHEVKTVPIYSDCRLPDAGRLHINEARSAANAAGGTLPAPAAAE